MYDARAVKETIGRIDQIGFIAHFILFLYREINSEYVTGPAKTRHICTFYTCLEISTFLGRCCSVNFICFPIDLSIWYKNFSNVALALLKLQ